MRISVKFRIMSAFSRPTSTCALLWSQPRSGEQDADSSRYIFELGSTIFRLALMISRLGSGQFWARGNPFWARFDHLRARFDQHSGRLDHIRARFDQCGARFDHIYTICFALFDHIRAMFGLGSVTLRRGPTEAGLAKGKLASTKAGPIRPSLRSIRPFLYSVR